MITTIDQLGRNIVLSRYPVKIVSLVPSQTELLFDLGLETEICGITKFCVHPPHLITTKNSVGGTKNLNLDKIFSLQPDLIIANKEENEESQITKLAKYFPVWISDVKNLQNAIQMIEEVSKIVGKEKESRNLSNKILENFKLLDGIKPKHKCAYLIWNDPMMTVGGDTFISDMLENAGFINVFKERKRYPKISADEILKKSPDILFLSSEPFPYFNKLIDKFRIDFPEFNIQLVDGEFFSWYGSRLSLAPSYYLSLREKLNI